MTSITFQSTRPVRGATSFDDARVRDTLVSIHAPRAGRDVLRRVGKAFSACFNPRAPCGARRQGRESPAFVTPGFNPRAPCGARPIRRRRGSLSSRVSIHAPRAGRDVDVCLKLGVPYRFQSTRPVRGATSVSSLPSASVRGFNPRAPCGARPKRRMSEAQKGKVSIHAPRAGRDPFIEDASVDTDCFNPRAPCGARPFVSTQGLSGYTFQSTRPVRGATGLVNVTVFRNYVSIHAPRAGRDGRWLAKEDETGCFNPRAPCGARLETWSICPNISWFQSTRPVRGATHGNKSGGFMGSVSIHAPRAGRDSLVLLSVLSFRGFNPRAPCGARPSSFKRSSFILTVSIHAPRAGRDSASRKIDIDSGCFNPRAPCGARQLNTRVKSDRTTFQSTRPVRGATIGQDLQRSKRMVSIHAPRAGRDTRLKASGHHLKGFNPRAPCGARQKSKQKEQAEAEFQSTRPVRGATVCQFPRKRLVAVSIHAPRAGRDRTQCTRSVARVCFNPRAPCGARP